MLKFAMYFAMFIGAIVIASWVSREASSLSEKPKIAFVIAFVGCVSDSVTHDSTDQGSLRCR